MTIILHWKFSKLDFNLWKYEKYHNYFSGWNFLKLKYDLKPTLYTNLNIYLKKTWPLNKLEKKYKLKSKDI